MINLLILSRYGDKGASSRLRLFQYIPYLKANGFEVEVSPFISNDYIDSLNAGGKFSTLKIIGFYFRRVWKLLGSSRFDLLIVEKELLPWFPPWLERVFHLLNIPYLLDIDDATFHRYDRNPHRFIRWFLGNKIASVMHFSSGVIAGNSYLANYAMNAGSPKTTILPTVIDLTRYSPKRKYRTETLVVGWIGSPTTTPYLKLAEKALQEISLVIPLKLILIGAGEPELKNISVERKAWCEETEVSEIISFDIGIMPLFDDDWERGKSGYKIIQYMACDVPVIASPVGINKDIIEHGVDGFLATSDQDWAKCIKELAGDPEKREKFGIKGRKKVESLYCSQVTAPQFIAAVRESLILKGK